MRQAHPDSVDERLAEQVWRFCSGEHAEVVSWLQRLGCTLVRAEQHDASYEYLLDGLVGVRSTLLYPPTDPASTFVIFGFLLAGGFWPQVYGEVNERWRTQRQQGPAAAMHYVFSKTRPV